MRKTKLSLHSIILLLCISLFYGCEEENDTVSTIEINKFIHDNMQFGYLWADQMPNLNPYIQTDSKLFFDNLLYKTIDRWSFITDDVDALYAYFAGVRKEMGYSLRGYYVSESSNQVVAIVELVYPETPAARAGLKRGDILVKIDGKNITESNYGNLFYNDQIEIMKGEIVGDEIYNLEPSITLSAEVIQINPIHKSEIFEVEGEKVGYLAYTGFIYEYNENLENEFAAFKAQGITDLILDLRYNSGGAISSAKLLASMICPASCKGEVFLHTAYNQQLSQHLENEYPREDIFNDYFEENINNLNLSRLYVLTSSGTASASEMVIYSLSPYMDIIQIGEITHGKYYGSITISDEQRHSWAIQPIVMRAENVDNSIDYSKGLPPDIDVRDDYTYELGTEDDYLTSIALSDISGVAYESVKLKKASIYTPTNRLKQKENPLKYEMYKDIKFE
jgi:C-terminal processing protease CtpA/Prc